MKGRVLESDSPKLRTANREPRTFPFSRWVKSPVWLRRFCLATGLCLAVLLVNLAVSELAPGNWWGLAYGWTAALLMAAAAAYGWRRRYPGWVTRKGLGSAQSWLQFHIYGGLLCLLLIWMHVGFRLPRGALAWALLLLSLWTIVSGLLGVCLQKWIPALLASGLQLEVLAERIPDLTRQLHQRAQALAEEGGTPLREFYGQQIAPTLQGNQLRWAYFLGVGGAIDERLNQFEYLSEALGGEERQQVRSLEEIYRQKLELDAHYTIQRVLRNWLALHVPISLLVLVLLAWHIFAVAYY